MFQTKMEKSNKQKQSLLNAAVVLFMKLLQLTVHISFIEPSVLLAQFPKQSNIKSPVCKMFKEAQYLTVYFV